MNNISLFSVFTNNNVKFESEQNVANRANLSINNIMNLYRENYLSRSNISLEDIENKISILKSQGQEFIGYIGIVDKCGKLFQDCFRFEELKSLSLNNENNFRVSVHSNVFIGEDRCVEERNNNWLIHDKKFNLDKESPLYHIRCQLDDIYIDYSKLYVERNELQEAIEFIVKVSSEKMNNSMFMIVDNIVREWENEKNRNACLEILGQYPNALPILKEICQQHVHGKDFERFKVTARMMRGTDDGKAAILSFLNEWTSYHFKEILNLTS